MTPGDMLADRPKQERSRLSAQRVLDASLELLEEHGFDAFTVVDVSKRAGVSVGAIYARFGNKESMLRAVHAHGMERMVEQHTAVARTTDGETGGLRENVVDAVDMVAAVFRGNEDLLRAFMRLGAVDDVVSERGSTSSKDLARRFKEKLLAHRAELVHPHPDIAVDVAYRMAYCTFARRVMDGPAYESELVVSWPDLVAEVGAACAAYLLEPRGPAPV